MIVAYGTNKSGKEDYFLSNVQDLRHAHMKVNLKCVKTDSQHYTRDVYA